ncbi:MAG: pitrilysin family protein [Phycisphaerae bacterium]|jgi:predicted Zn-dependent peptidase
MDFKQTVLDNGLTIIAEVNPDNVSMAAGFFVRTGSRDETPSVAGVSHFLEHMVFKGTARRSPFDVNREFDEMGAEYNAFTSEENTVFYGAVLREFQSRLVDLLADILRPSLRGEDFDMEKNVILDEIARYEDQPSYRVYEKLMAEHFRGHPLGNSVLGTTESIKALQLGDMKDYFNRRYSPGNVTVVAVGNLDWPALVDKVAQCCSHWKHFDVARDLPAAPRRLGRLPIVDTRINREHIGLMSPAPTSQDPQRFAARLASTVVGDHNGSRLFYALVEPAIADEASLAYDGLDGAGAFLTFISTDPDRAAQSLRIAHDVLRRFQDEGPSDIELQAAKNKIASSATLKGELPMGRLTTVGFDWVYRKEYVPLAAQIDKLLAVSAADVLDVARKYDMTATTIVALGPAEEI